jgi:hypothetical protein
MGCIYLSLLVTLPGVAIFSAVHLLIDLAVSLAQATPSGTCGRQQWRHAHCAAPLTITSRRPCPVACRLPDQALLLSADGNTSTVLLGLRASTGGSQWVAVGFPASPSRMLGATAFVLKACPTCPSGKHPALLLAAG